MSERGSARGTMVRARIIALGVSTLVASVAHTTWASALRAETPDPAAIELATAWVLQPVNPSQHAPALPTLLRRAWSRPTLTVAVRNANPLNIKVGSLTRRYLDAGVATVSQTIPLDGGQFLAFTSSTHGFRAALDLLSSGSYYDLDMAAVFARWSHSGYGTEVLQGTGVDGRLRVRDLDQTALAQVLYAMAVAEGYQSRAIHDEIANAFKMQ